MKPRHITILCLVLLGLLGIYFFQQMRSTNSFQQAAAKVELNPQIDPASVNRIVIAKGPDDSLVLAKAENRWQIESAKEATGSAVNTALMDDLLGILSGVPVELVSQNVERQQSLGVTNEQAMQVRYLNGEEERYVLLISPQNNQIIRQKDKQNVYKWSTTYSRLIDTDANYWAAPTPMPTQEASESGEVTE